MRRRRAVNRRRQIERERRVLFHQVEKRLLVDQRDFGRLARDRGGATRRPLDQGHLAESAVGPDVLEHSAARKDANLARAHDVHARARVVLDEDLGVHLETLQREAAACEEVEIEGRLGHGGRGLTAYACAEEANLAYDGDMTGTTDRKAWRLRYAA